MREILFRGETSDGEWVEGILFNAEEDTFIIPHGNEYSYNPIEGLAFDVYGCKVAPETVGQYTGLTDKNGKRIFEGDIVRYNTYDDFDCQSVVKFGEYNQDGSAGEYSANKCIGFYVDVDNFTCPDWCEYGSNCFSNYLKQQNILEVAQYCEIIGNIHDNPELME